MKKFGFLRFLLIVVGIVITVNLIGCKTGTLPGEIENENEPVDPVDPAFWFGEIYDELIARIGEISSEEYSSDMGQIANNQYVCNAINAKLGTSYVPVSGTATQAANCEYLLKMIDKANNNATSFGTGGYATKQAVDKIAVDTAVQRLWKPAGSAGKFVVIADGSNKIIYSTNGIDWTEATTLSNSAWRDVTYGNGKFVAISQFNSSNSGIIKVAYSTDNITNWIEKSINGSSWQKIIYGNDKFVAISANSVFYSNNGIDWTEKELKNKNNGTASWSDIIYELGKFIVIGGYGVNNSNYTAYSTNGIDWSLVSPGLAMGYYQKEITYGNGKFVAISDDLYRPIAYSTNGIDWTYNENRVPILEEMQSGLLTYGNGKFVVIRNNKVAFSIDGINWGETTIPSSTNWGDVTYGNGKFVTVAGDGYTAYSIDGVNWITSEVPNITGTVRITYSGE